MEDLVTDSPNCQKDKERRGKGVDQGRWPAMPGDSLPSSSDHSISCLLERCLLASAKGFAIGAGLKGGLALFGAITKALKKKSLAASSLPKSSGRDTLLYGLFLGTYSGGFCVVEEAIAAALGHRSTARWRALIAGAIAGPSLLLTGQEAHTSMAIYVFLRAAVLLARCGIKSKRYHRLFSVLQWQHGDVFLMCLSSMQILSAWIMNPSTLPPSYVAFLDKHGGKHCLVMQTLRQLAHRRLPLVGVRSVEDMYASMGVQVTLDPNMNIPCQMLHPNMCCGAHFLKFLTEAYFRSVPVYLPVYVVPALLVHRLNILKSPVPILLKTALGLARSSFFLASFCASAWLFTCSIHQGSRVCSPLTVALGSFPAGMAVLFEKKSRRMELALYCLSRAIESFALACSAGDTHHEARGRGGGGSHLGKPTTVKAAATATATAANGLVPVKNKGPGPPLSLGPLRLDVVLFSTATAIIMHCYAQEREVFRSKYLNVLDWVFGVPGKARGYRLASVPPTPVPANQRQQQCQQLGSSAASRGSLTKDVSFDGRCDARWQDLVAVSKKLEASSCEERTSTGSDDEKGGNGSGGRVERQDSLSSQKRVREKGLGRDGGADGECGAERQQQSEEFSFLEGNPGLERMDQDEWACP